MLRYVVGRMRHLITLIALAGIAAGALVANAGAQARPGNGEGQAIRKAEAAEAVEAWYQAEAHFFEGMTPSQIQRLRNQFQHQFKQRTIHRPPQPDDCAGLRAIIC